ncbi:DUF6527 family protein [Iningainema tapete]|uniref:DUF6527 family protein n=1 Tax=Iningainema tapete TaxID=2806730 RepID=UPI003B588635
MSKLLPIYENSRIVGFFFDCPGCKMGHAVHARPYKNKIGASWTFNGSLDKPTFRPSILAKVERSDVQAMVCHSFVTDGRIRFLQDCTHSLVGRTVDLPEQIL